MLAFSLSRCRFQKKIELRKLFNLNSRLRWGAKYPRCTEYAHYFLISNCVIQVIFWTEDNLCFISGFRNSFNCKLKKLINEQIIIFYSSVFPFHLVQSANTRFLLMKTQRVLYRSSECENVCHHKNQVFL